MPPNLHPAAVAFGSRDDQEMAGYAKLHLQQTVADAQEVRDTDFSLQFGGLFVRSIAATFYLDTEDLSADDGVNVIIDNLGNHFARRAVDAGELTQRVHTAAGAVTVTADDVDIIIVDKTVGAPTTVNLCSAADRTKPVQLVDGKGDALTNSITIVPQSGEKIMAIVDYQYPIDSNGASIKLTPRADGTGWV